MNYLMKVLKHSVVEQKHCLQLTNLLKIEQRSFSYTREEQKFTAFNGANMSYLFILGFK